MARRKGITESGLSRQYPRHDVHHTERIRWWLADDGEVHMHCPVHNTELLHRHENRGSVKQMEVADTRHNFDNVYEKAIKRKGFKPGKRHTHWLNEDQIKDAISNIPTGKGGVDKRRARRAVREAAKLRTSYTNMSILQLLERHPSLKNQPAARGSTQSQHTKRCTHVVLLHTDSRIITLLGSTCLRHRKKYNKITVLNVNV